jgi:uncharacterized membrane protein YdjX (TVP38/TMEM64 family)
LDAQDAPNVDNAKKPRLSKQAFRNILIILIVIGLTVLIYLERHWIRELGVLGYPGAFLVGLVSSAAMFAPVPGLLVLAAMGTALDPFAAGMLFAVGASLGELSGYFAGFAGQGTVEKVKFYSQMEGYMKKYGGVTIFVLGLIPNVLIDVAGMVAGALRMPWYKFLFWCFLGKVPKCLLVAYGGVAVMHFLR